MSFLTRFCLSLAAALLLFSGQAFAKAVDIVADEISRDAEGVVVAAGNVVIEWENDTLQADQVRYHADKHLLEATGHVILKSAKSVIQAEQAQMDTESKTGEMQDAVITLTSGERLTAEKVRRIDEHTFEAENLIFSSCPIDQESWRIAARRALLDQNEAELTANHARFELWEMPLLYAPWWQQPLKRRSGLLTPKVSLGKRRGTEVALPYYLAPAPDWDATLTPHWMSARGVMGMAELRHASSIGHEQFNVAGIRDTLTNSSRSQLQAEVEWQLPADLRFQAEADHISDLDYLADFGGGTDVSARYLQSMAALSQSIEGDDLEANWMLMARHQQDLLQASNASTLHILPRLESDIAWSAHPYLQFHFDQQATRFDRRLGVDGWRLDLHPYVEVPWEMAGGGVSATLQLGGHHTRYWLMQTAQTRRKPTRTTLEGSLEVSAEFERINDSRNWRHAISPIIRYDYIETPKNQASLPNFDSGFGQLTWSNLLSGNRYSGLDRIERARRLSLLLENRLQYKADAEATARDILVVRAGVAYDRLRTTVDNALQTAPTRPFSNLLGEVSVNPIPELNLYASGQYNPTARYWATTTASASLATAEGHQLSIIHQHTDTRYATRAELLTVSGDAHLSSRWHVNGYWQYDRLLKITQQTAIGVKYDHPCWTLGVEGYRLNRPSGTATASDYGYRILLEFKGLGSVGS